MILFLAANPSGTGQLALDREARSIHAELRRSGHRDRFEFVTRWAAEPLDLLREIRELRPTVVHFSGHGGSPAEYGCGTRCGRDVAVEETYPTGTSPGLIFQRATGGMQAVSREAIAQTFAAAGASVRLVVLSACFTAPIAEALLAHVDCVVGMSGAIHDDAARIFAVGFYGGLGEHESVATAFEQGRAAIHLDGLRDSGRPQFKVRPELDAAQLILAVASPLLRTDLPCPYPGMRPYLADEAAVFHGREPEIDDLIGRLRAGEREIYVIGPSGSGKSSLLTAGLLPRLARGIPGLGPFVVRTMRPGDRPAARLHEALNTPSRQPAVIADAISALLAHRTRDAAVLLVIDQLEELFTLASASDCNAFLAALRMLRAERRCAVIATLRADFFGALMESALWPERRRAQLSRIEVGPLRGQRLRDAIAVPAHDMGVRIDPELIERLLADAAYEPGVLPHLQEALVQLWDKRADQTLTLADYQALGDGERSGLAVALARRGEATLRRFSAAQAELARRVLLRLISFGDGRSDTRRQQVHAQLRAAGDDPADFDLVMQTMIQERLLTVDDDAAGEPRVDLAHEIMISAWPKLADWIRSHRADEQRRRQLEAAATAWRNHGRGIRGLLDPLELADAELWQKTESATQLGQSVEVTALIAASRATLGRQRRRRRLVAGVMSVLGVIAIAVAVGAVAARDQRNEARRLASLNRRLVAQSYAETGRQFLIDGRYQEAVPYLLAAREHGDDSTPLRMMFWEAKRHMPLMSPLEHQAEVVSAAFSADGARVVTASRDGTAQVWEAATGQPLTGSLEHQATVSSAAFSLDGARVGTASYDKTARVWDAATGKPLAGPLAHRAAVWSIAFSSDGTRVVTASKDRTARVWDAVTGLALTNSLVHRNAVTDAVFSPDGARVVTTSGNAAQVWNATTGKPLARPLKHREELMSAAFSPDGTCVVTASWDGTARVWDAMTGEPRTALLGHNNAVMSATFSPDGTRVVTSSVDTTARVWDAATGEPLAGPLAHHDAVWSAMFSSDGTRLVTASSDKSARVWNAATGEPLTSPLQHQAEVWGAAFSPDGMRVVTASADKTARVWNASTDEPLARRLRHQNAVMSAAFSPDGMRAVTASSDKTARIWDAVTGVPLFCPLEHQNAVSSAAFSPDGDRVVTASYDRTARIWHVATGEPIGRPLEHQNAVLSAAFSPDGTRVVTASADRTARVWDAATGRPLGHPLEHQAEVLSAAFSPDGMRVVTASADRTARVWHAATGNLLARPLEHQAEVSSAAFSPDGTRVVTASADKTARVWDAATGRPHTRPLEHQAAVSSVAFSPDGTRIVTASDDRTAWVWDAATGRPHTSPLEHRGAVLSAAFSPDGTRVVTASRDRTARVWDAATGKPLTRPLEHQAAVSSAAFSPDGARVITASDDATAGTWDIRPDPGTLDEWFAIAQRSPFALEGSVLVRRSPLHPASKIE